MVQEKNAAQKRVAAREAERKRIAEDLERRTVATKWSVEEVTPGYEEWGYYGQHVPEKFVKVSEYFNTKEEAQAWMDGHEADAGKFLAIRKHIGREYREVRWISVRVKN